MLAPLALSLQIRDSSSARRITRAWRNGELAARIARGAIVALLLVLAISLWQGLRLRSGIGCLESRISKLQTDLGQTSSIDQAARPLDFVHGLPDAPSVAQIMQTLQQAADKEGARVESLQADDHPPTDATLGHFDLVISIRATYPATLAVLQQVLDRYPAAAIRQLDLTHAVTPTAAMSTTPALSGGANVLPASSATEARVLLAVWRRPSDAPLTNQAPADRPTSRGTSAGSGSASTALGGSPAERASGATVAASAERPSSGGH